MHALLIANMTAGSNSPNRLELLRHAARMLGHTLDIVLPDTATATAAVAADAAAQGYTRVLCAGGDGTINQVAAGLANSELPLGIIPLGTANVLARELRLPLDPAQALRVAFSGQIQRIDLGMANGQPFTLMAGLGFDAQVVAEVVPRVKAQFGPLAYISAGLQVMTRYRPSMFHIEMNGIAFSIPAWLVVIGNASYYAYQFTIAPTARLDDGLLDVCIFAERRVLDRLMQIIAVFARQHVRLADVVSFRATAVRIDADPPVHVQLDGDAAGFSPVEINVRPAALQVVTPHGHHHSHR